MNYKDIFPLVLILSNTFNMCAFWGFGFLEDDKFHSHSMRVWKFHWNSCPFVPLSFSIFSHFVLASLYLIHSSDDFYWCGQITCRSDWYELGFLGIKWRICIIICNLRLLPYEGHVLDCYFHLALILFCFVGEFSLIL